MNFDPDQNMNYHSHRGRQSGSRAKAKEPEPEPEPSARKVTKNPDDYVDDFYTAQGFKKNPTTKTFEYNPGSRSSKNIHFNTIDDPHRDDNFRPIRSVTPPSVRPIRTYEYPGGNTLRQDNGHAGQTTTTRGVVIRYVAAGTATTLQYNHRGSSRLLYRPPERRF